MPVLKNHWLVGFHEVLGKMTDADLRDYADALRPFLRTNPITVERKLKDIDAELEWRRAAHPKRQAKA